MSVYLKLNRRLNARLFLAEALRRGPVYVDNLISDAADQGVGSTDLYAAAAGRVRTLKYPGGMAWQLNEQTAPRDAA